MELADWIRKALRSRKNDTPKRPHRPQSRDEEEEETDGLLALEII